MQPFEYLRVRTHKFQAIKLVVESTLQTKGKSGKNSPTVYFFLSLMVLDFKAKILASYN